MGLLLLPRQTHKYQWSRTEIWARRRGALNKRRRIKSLVCLKEHDAKSAGLSYASITTSVYFRDHVACYRCILTRIGNLHRVSYIQTALRTSGSIFIGCLGIFYLLRERLLNADLAQSSTFVRKISIKVNGGCFQIFFFYLINTPAFTFQSLYVDSLCKINFFKQIFFVYNYFYVTRKKNKIQRSISAAFKSHFLFAIKKHEYIFRREVRLKNRFGRKNVNFHISLFFKDYSSNFSSQRVRFVCKHSINITRGFRRYNRLPVSMNYNRKPGRCQRANETKRTISF